MKFLQSEILTNRQKWIDKLLDPATKKAKGVLEDAKDNECRCCLGHGAFVMAPELRTIRGDNWVYYGDHCNTAPARVERALGLWNDLGAAGGDFLSGFKLCVEGYGEFISLAMLNDETEITPQEIGKYLQSVIEGGIGTPFRPITDYPLTREEQA